ncbi:pentatricopeptide repeat-containing protein At2g13600 [Amborella trichopoda]|uniref:pentatricopeptide repeat-containing protein At2g13600 n=1 Tax=Amborella trichopoda TaxID=13333 RepID=UPI0009BFB349|nr:pentatricopeptide repeat-containing protein At2g13600 [Amborella trichopoda]|eukprot:XP_011625363.2 pentatricopeptide repeat-containing protein At2g13600 [Amborella trichopoda]
MKPCGVVFNPAKSDQLKSALKTLSSTHPSSSFNAYSNACASLLNACATNASTKHGKVIHAHLTKLGFLSHRFLSLKLLIMYVRCNSFHDANSLFNEMGDRSSDLIASNCMISAYSQMGLSDQAKRLFDKMPERNIVSWTALITCLMQCGKVHDACEYFHRIPTQSVVSFTAIISGYVQNGLHIAALKIFREMYRYEVLPNDVTFICIIRGCVCLRWFREGKCVMGQIVRLGFQSYLPVSNSIITLLVRMGDMELARRVFDGMAEKDVVSWTAILDLYVEKGEFAEARKLFDAMPERNEVSWSAMIARYSQNGEADEALKLYGHMVSEGLRPNLSTFSSILSVSASLEDLKLGKKIHGYVLKLGFDSNVFIGSPLIDMYAKCGKTKEAKMVFEMIPEKNTVSWNSMIAGLSHNGLVEEALQLFEQMPERNVVSWNAIISGYVQNELCEQGLELYSVMETSGELPNQSTFSSVLRACASIASLERGRNIHGKIVKFGVQYDVFMGTALTDMYAKSGDIESAKLVFHRMPEKNEISFTAMIQGLADNGFGEEALILFEKMEESDIAPTELTFLGVLFACAHCGMVNRGKHYFDQMQSKYHIKPKGKHYTSMVDLLARAGLLQEAENFLSDIPFDAEANSWASLLSACKTYKDHEMGERVAGKLWELEQNNSAGYVLLSNIYASVGQWSDVSRVRKLMKEKGLKKGGGCSWIEVKDMVHTFYVGDKCHEESDQIFEVLDLLILEMTDPS